MPGNVKSWKKRYGPELSQSLYHSLLQPATHRVPMRSVQIKSYKKR
jgi:hypothetical protein